MKNRFARFICSLAGTVLGVGFVDFFVPLITVICGKQINVNSAFK